MLVASLVLAISTILLLLKVWVKRRYSIWKDMGVLYEEPHFPYGSLKGVKANAHEGQTMEKFYQKFKDKTPFVGMFIALEPIALILDVELVKRVLISDFSAFQDRGIFSNAKHEPISAHIAVLSQKKWKSVRSQLSPAFTIGKVKTLIPLILEAAEKLDSVLDEISENGKDLDVKQLTARFTVDIIGSYVLGLDCNCLKYDNDKLYRIVTGIFDNPLDGALMIFIKLALRRHAETLRLKTFRKEVSEFFTKIVKDAVEFRVANNVHRKDLLETLISAYQSDGEGHMPFNEVLAQAFGFFMAGVETTASTLQFCLYELAKNHELQAKTRKHIIDVLDKYDQVLSYKALMNMKYVDQLIYETLRMYPTVGCLTREVVKDYLVPHTNITLKEGTLIMIPVYAIHHDPEFYPNPIEFNPDRFTEENIRGRPPSSFLGFGDGPRNCIGNKLGMMQAKIGIVTFLRHYKFLLAKRSMQPLQLETRTFITNPAEKIYLNVERVRHE